MNATTTALRASIDHFGPWQIAYGVKHCMCPDGIRRYARLTGQPDTFFSIPASVKYGGVTVSGFVTGRSNPEGEDYEFCPYTYRKNAALFAKHICPECGNTTADGATFATPELGCCDTCAEPHLARQREEIALADIVGDLMADGLGREQAESLAWQQVRENELTLWSLERSNRRA